MDDKTRAEKSSRPRSTAAQALGLMPDVEPAGPLGPTPCRGGFALSPINKRRWQNFKTNRRGYWSLWIFLVLFVVTLFAEFIANDKPLYINYDGKILFSGCFHLSGHRLSAAISAPRPITAIPMCRN